MAKKRENQQIGPAYLSSLQPWGRNAAFNRLSLVCTVKSENVSDDAEQPLRFRLDENGALMWTWLDNVLVVSLLFAALQCHVPRGLFLESPETFRAYFG